jgi:hypothetical protein
MNRLLNIVLASLFLIGVAHACDFKTEPAALRQFFRSEGWVLPEISSGKVSAPIVFRGYPKDWWKGPLPFGPIPGLTVRMITRDPSEANLNLFEIPRQEYEQDDKHRMMSSQYLAFDHQVYRYEVEGKVVAYTFRLTPTEGHWNEGKWISEGEVACDFIATFVDNAGDGVFRVLLPGALTPDLVPRWALDRQRISN